MSGQLGPEVPLPGRQGQHSDAKDSFQPVNNNVGLVGLCSILFLDGLVELLQAQLPLDERQLLVGQQPLVGLLETKTTF